VKAVCWNTTRWLQIVYITYSSDCKLLLDYSNITV